LRRGGEVRKKGTKGKERKHKEELNLISEVTVYA